MLKSMRATILLFAVAMVILSTIGITFFAQRKVSTFIYKSELLHAQELVDSTLINVSTEYQGYLSYKGAVIKIRNDELRNMVDIAKSLILLNYRKYEKGEISEKRAKEISLQQLREFRYDGGKGYIWVIDSFSPYPNMLMHPANPELNGKKLDRPEFYSSEDGGKNLFVEARGICETSEGGYFKYSWPAAQNGTGKALPKLAYASKFKEWNWIISSSIYMTDVEKEISGKFSSMISNIEKLLRSIRIGKSGYVFIFTGSKDLLIHPAYKGADINNLVNPRTGRLLFDEFREVSKHGSIIDYYWDKPPGHVGDYSFEKRAYVRYFEPLDWYICSTVYLDELFRPGADLRNNIITLSLIFLVVALVFAGVIAARIAHPLLKLTSAVREIRERGVLNAAVPVEGPTEVRELGVAFNKMLSSIRKEIAEKETLNDALEKSNRELFATNHKLEEEIAERVQVAKELLRLRNHQSNILDSMPSVLVGVDVRGLINQWNSVAAGIKGLSFEEVEGRPLNEIFPDLSIELEKARKDIVDGRTVNRLRVPRVCGEDTVYENITISPVMSNGLDGVVIRVDDVTERVHIEEMMVQTEKMISVGGLAAGMAHEINNPLGGILHGVQNIERRLSKDLKTNLYEAEKISVPMEKIQSYIQARGIFRMLEGIRNAAERSAAIITNMLNFSRKPDTQRTLCKLDELIENAISLAGQDYDLSKKYDFRQIQICKDFEKDIPLVSCSPSEVEQVILNLLTNAAQALFDLHGREDRVPRITIRLYVQGEYLAVEVEDNGSGMDDSVRKRAFEPFYTTKPKGMGTGLGLSVSYFIITENHHGNFTIESKPGRGAKFVFKLPCKTPLT